MTEGPDFQYLISRHLNGQVLSTAEGALLSAWIRQDAANADEMALAALSHSHLYEVFSAQRLLDDENLTPDPFTDTAVMPAVRLSEEREDVQEVLISLPVPPVKEAARAPGIFRTWRIWRGAAALLLAAGLGIVAWRWTHEKALASVTASYQAHWDDSRTFDVGDRIPAAPLYLKSGLAELHMASGAAVLVEGPAHLQVLSDNSVELIDGKLSAKVPQSAHGFMVETLTARVVDLGTEFGVSADMNGATEVDVFKGTVQAKARNADPSAAPTALIAGQAAAISSTSLTLASAGARPQAFVRELAVSSEPLDVLDLICGGDGTTHARQCRIDERSGVVDLANATFSAVGDSDAVYHRISGLPVLDGTFVPDDDSIVNSAQSRFTFRPTGGSTFNSIFVGGRPSWFSEGAGANYPIRLGSTDYSIAPHGYVYMHPNVGLTINLAEIRRLHPGRPLGSFRAVVGNFRNTVHGQSVLTVDKADAFVLVDGTARFERLDFTRLDGAIPVQVPIRDTDRFLTLAVTQGSDGMNSDWVIFGDPQFQ